MFRRLYGKNTEKLISHLRFIEGNDVAVAIHLGEDSLKFHNEYIMELHVLLYNYLSSRGTVIDLARKIHQDYPIDAYETATDEFKMNGENRFLGELRNFVVHNDTLPLIQESSFSVGRDGASASFSHDLSGSGLLESGWSWGTEAKQYLRSHDKIKLLDIILRNHKKFTGTIEVMLDCIQSGDFPKDKKSKKKVTDSE